MIIFPKTNNKLALIAIFFISISLLSGCANNEIIEAEVNEIEIDPLETFNRKVFIFNDTLDHYVAEPISDAYLWVTPKFVQSGIANFFNNLKDINVVLNDVMQGKIQQGTEDVARFTINTAFGFLGLLDIATQLGLKKHEEDFSQTLAVWGVPEGAYLVLPILGSSTSRGVLGSIFDTVANPATYVGAPIQLVQMLNLRANAKDALNFIDEAALDPYIFTRESFLQYRRYLATDGNAEITDDLYDDELFIKDSEQQ